MQLISHRGLWTRPEDRNSLTALIQAIELGFGIETDIRDLNGQLVISHDMADETSPKLSDFLTLYRQYDSKQTLALNVKADGLQDPLRFMLAEFHIERYFVFDMSIPDALGYLDRRMKLFTRQSEYEPVPAFEMRSVGVWIDGFESDWFEESVIQGHLENDRQVCIVSPELHGRDRPVCWEMLARMKCAGNPSLMLCTDYPLEARSFFSDRN